MTWYPSYGSEMRGGTANCNIKMDDKEIPSPYCHDIDILYTLNDAAIDKFEVRSNQAVSFWSTVVLCDRNGSSVMT